MSNLGSESPIPGFWTLAASHSPARAFPYPRFTYLLRFEKSSFRNFWDARIWRFQFLVFREDGFCFIWMHF